jgi:hypothetical protein
MASVTRTVPASFGLSTNFLGKTLAHLDIDFGANVSTKLGPTSAVASAMDAIQGAGFNIVIIGPLHAAGGADNNVSICVEGDFGTDTYDGSNSETLAVHLEDVVQALGTVDSVNLGLATVTAKTYVL